MITKKVLFLAIGVVSVIISWSQQPLPKKSKSELLLSLNEDGSHYVKATMLGQVWSRYTETNDGSKLNGHSTPEVYDLGIRRLRFQLYGKLSDRVFFYVQFGQNNLNYQSKQNTGAFFHDAITEYELINKKLSIGCGLTGWSGLSRYASPAVASILGVDVPLYQQATNGVNDQFLRKLSWYAKGKLGKLDYRLALSKPFLAQNAVSPVGTLNTNSDFATDVAPMQQQAYIMYQFLDNESNVTPYTAGSYLGNKRVFNLGFGIIRERNAMWYMEGTDTLRHTMLLIGGDVFFDGPVVSGSKNSFTAYASFHKYDFGKNYVREIGVMNPIASGVSDTYNGAGNSVPLVGTGNVGHLQLGYLPGNLEFKEGGKIQFYAEETIAKWNALSDLMMLHEAGVNYFIHGMNAAKLTLGGQWRPIFKTNSTTSKVENTGYKPMIIFQYQITI